jgi:hypothetical protein
MTIAERIAELREYAREDGDRCNENSIADFLAFPPEIAEMEGPYLFMEEGGNLRALWRNASLRFGIDFYGEGKARLVVLGLYLVNHKSWSEMTYFNLAGIPPELNQENLLAFVKEHRFEPVREAETVSEEPAIV